MRLTRKKDDFKCRVGKGDCTVEDWIENLTGLSIYNWESDDFCEICPFEKYINRLADFEDEAEKMEDDLK